MIAIKSGKTVDARRSDSNRRVQLVWFVQERDAAPDIELLIGVYDTEADARAAIERLKNKPGFADFPEGFQIHWRELGKDSWDDGFVQAD
jgi:hypothetical protein